MSIDTDETDIVLGASFREYSNHEHRLITNIYDLVRNAYLLNHYGSDIKESKKDGYTQLLPLTTDSETGASHRRMFYITRRLIILVLAHKEFEAARCNGEDCDEFRKKEAKKTQ